MITAWAPPHLGALLCKWFWKDDRPTAPAMKVWLDTCRYLYMPRLQTADAFLPTVRDGVGHTDWFAYAAGAKEGGAFEGLIFGASGGVYLSEGSLLVRPDAAAAAQAAAGAAATTGSERPRRPSDAPPASVAGKAKKLSGAPAETAPRRFHGTAIIDHKDPISHFAEVVQNVIEHFTAHCLARPRDHHHVACADVGGHRSVGGRGRTRAATQACSPARARAWSV